MLIELNPQSGDSSYLENCGNYKPAAQVLNLDFSSAEGTTCESMGCKSHVSETTSLKVPVGMTGVEHQVCVYVECKAKNHNLGNAVLGHD